MRRWYDRLPSWLQFIVFMVTSMTAIFTLALILTMPSYINGIQTDAKLFENESPTTRNLYFKYDKYTDTCWAFYKTDETKGYSYVPCTEKVKELGLKYPFEKD